MLCLAALAAGWIDAVVGGGGLLLLPALLVGLPHTPAAYVLGTNKSTAIVGTTAAAITYVRKALIDVRTALRIGLAAMAGSVAGAFFAAGINSEVLRPLIMAVLLGVLAFVLFRPAFGTAPAPSGPVSRTRVVAAVLVAGLGIGFYDGLIGPGTGAFLIVALTAILHMDLVSSSATAKVVNVCTNIGALTMFAIQGTVLWQPRRPARAVQPRRRHGGGQDGAQARRRLRPWRPGGRGRRPAVQAGVRPVAGGLSHGPSGEPRPGRCCRGRSAQNRQWYIRAMSRTAGTFSDARAASR